VPVREEVLWLHAGRDLHLRQDLRVQDDLRMRRQLRLHGRVNDADYVAFFTPQGDGHRRTGGAAQDRIRDQDPHR
jgi:hypothetical protein